MAAEIEGTITCPHCGNREATVHRQAKGKRSLYYRCYTRQGGAEMRCGTVQIHGPKGQEWIKANMHRAQPAPANDAKAPDPAPEPQREPANDAKAPDAPKRRQSVFNRFIENLAKDDEE